jgi:hypothetical protein
MKFLENSSSESRIPCGRSDRLTDVKLIVVFRNFANAPQNDDKNGIAVPNVLLLRHVITNCNAKIKIPAGSFMRNFNKRLQINFQKYLQMTTIMIFWTVKIKNVTYVK